VSSLGEKFFFFRENLGTMADNVAETRTGQIFGLVIW